MGRSKRPTYTAPNEILQEIADDGDSGDVLQRRMKERAVSAKEGEYQRGKYRLYRGDRGEKEGEKEKESQEKDQQPRIEDESLENGSEADQTRENGGKTPIRDEDGDKTPLREEDGDTTPIRDEDGDKTPVRVDEDVVSEPPRKRKRRWDVAPAEEEKPSDEQRQLEILAKCPVIDGIELNDATLDILLPPGFKKVPVPSDYKPATLDMPDLSSFEPGYMIPEQSAMATESRVDPRLINEVPGMRDIERFSESDMSVFGQLIATRDIPDDQLSTKERRDRECMGLILKVKNGLPATRKVAMRQLSDGAKSYGADTIFDIILPLMMSKTIEEQERHLLVKLIGRVLFQLGDAVRPYTKKILTVTMPLLIDENLYTRLQGQEIIAHLSRAAGLANMISTLRPDIDHTDDYVRNLVARTLAIVASTLGIQLMLPFLKAVSSSKKSWLARHTGVRTVQQIAILTSSGCLPYLNGLVSCVSHNIEDENVTVRIMAARAITSLALSSKPYGYESLEPTIEPLWRGMKKLRGRGLAAFLRALGSLIPLMDEEYANYYTREVFKVMSREFSSTDDQMRQAILRIIQDTSSMEVIDKKLFAGDFLDDFFENFWTRRAAMDRRVSHLVVDAAHALSAKTGTGPIVEKVLFSLKDESEPFRRMAIDTASRIIDSQGAFDLDDRAVNRLLDGLLYAFQHQASGLDDRILLSGFGQIMNSLGIRVKPHLMAIVSVILYRLKNKDPEVRREAADLIARIGSVLRVCGEEDLLVRLGTILYESLGEVYPEVLGTVLDALRSIVTNVKNVESLNPPISQLLSTLTPILRNRHEKVQESSIDLIGDIADRAKDFVNHREWMRISFELLEMLKASRKSIRKAATRTFGLIASAIGPSDVLVTLLNNLRVQERQLRVCTAVAIGIVAETCLPYTVLPAMMNEYRYPDKNVQNGILKAMTFMFEYIGDLGADYVYATTPLLADALTDRELVHRQTAATVVKHMALGSLGMGYEDAFVNFLDLIWSNIFETSPHVVARVTDAIESLRLVLGSGILMNYLLGGLFHPALKVRQAYWRIYNTMYVNSAHSLVPYYPRLEAVGDSLAEIEPSVSERHDLGVSELDVWV